MMSTSPKSPVSLLIPGVLEALITRLGLEQVGTVEMIAGNVLDVFDGGGRVLCFGAGHAQAFAMELHSRAGGLTGFVSMSLEDLNVEPRPFRMSLSDSAPERQAQSGADLLAFYDVTASDMVIVASHSGRNSASIEMALECRSRGTTLVAVTSLAHAAAVTSRHSSGQKLHEVADIVVDTFCPTGDAALEVATGEKLCATSTVAFACVAQMLVESVYRQAERAGQLLPILVSANIERANL